MILGIGTDVVRVSRIERLLAKYPDFVGKVFTPREIAYCSSKSSPAQSYAARFAAKEAVMKALGTGWSGTVSWQDIEVVKEGDGRPEIVVYNSTQDFLASHGMVRIHLSLAHESEYATAFVILEEQKT